MTAKPIDLCCRPTAL